MAVRGGGEGEGAGRDAGDGREEEEEDGDDLGYEDDYPVESISLTTGDYVYPKTLPAGQFKSVWESLSAQGTEATKQLSLNFKSLESAVEGICAQLNMEACDK